MVSLFSAGAHAQLTINTFAGNGSAGYSGDGGPAAAASLNQPPFVATDGAGNVYIADQNNNRVRRVDTHGIITTFAGNGTNGFGGDGGPAVSATLSQPTGVFADNLGSVFIADVGNQRICKVHTSGNITTVAGSGVKGYGGDGGPASAASFFNAVRAITDPAGNIYIADQSNHRVRKVDTSGTITTIAGTGVESFSGDGGPAVAAALDNPTAIALDLSGNLYICDQFNHRLQGRYPRDHYNNCGQRDRWIFRRWRPCDRSRAALSRRYHPRQFRQHILLGRFQFPRALDLFGRRDFHDCGQRH